MIADNHSYLKLLEIKTSLYHIKFESCGHLKLIKTDRPKLNDPL